MSNQRPANPKLAAACCGPIDDLLDPELFRAICDPTRASLLACVAKCGRACSVSEIAECCRVDISVVSRHLAQLARAGVLAGEKTGRSVMYSVRFDELARTLRDLAAALEECGRGGPSAAGCCGGTCENPNPTGNP